MGGRREGNASSGIESGTPFEPPVTVRSDPMASRARLPLSLCLLAAVSLAPAFALAGPEDPPPAPPGGPTPPAPAGPAGPVFQSPELGVTVQGPAGWALVGDRAAPPSWTRLCTFSESASRAMTVVSVRKPQAATLARMRAEVQKQYADDRSFSVQSVTDLPATPQRPLPGVLVDAVQARPVEGAPAPLAGGAVATVAWRVQAAYFVGASMEYLVYTQVPATVWSRVEAAVVRLRDSFAARDANTSTLPKGEGAYRDEIAGFACRYPSGHGVTIPKRRQHLVEFAPQGEGPVLGVYLYESQANLDEESKTLVEYYRGDEVGGEAETAVREVAGRPAAIVTAKGHVGGKEQVFFVAVVKRGTDTFRVRVAADASLQAKAKAAFDEFLKSVMITNSGG